MPVVPHPPLAAASFPGASLVAAEPEPVEEVRIHRQTPQVPAGGRPGRPRLFAGLVGVDGHRNQAGGDRRWQRERRREAGDVEVGGVEEEKVVEVRGEAEGGVGVGTPVVGPTLRHPIQVHRRRRLSDELLVHRKNKKLYFLFFLFL